MELDSGGLSQLKCWKTDALFEKIHITCRFGFDEFANDRFTRLNFLFPLFCIYDQENAQCRGVVFSWRRVVDAFFCVYYYLLPEL